MNKKVKTEVDEDLAVKSQILSNNITFKSAFMATLGFYVGQLVVTVLGLVILVGGAIVAYKIFN